MIFNIPAFSSSVILFSSLLFLTMITITIVVLPLNNDALGQCFSSSSSSTTTTQQTWINKLNNLKMQFGYLPK
ncbi:MAG: hypothetical protein ACJ71I_12235, partial [Nitrososphaeraceae archaeon]